MYNNLDDIYINELFVNSCDVLNKYCTYLYVPVLTHGHGGRTDAVNEIVGQHEIDMAIDVRVGAEILVEASRVSLADAMRVVPGMLQAFSGAKASAAWR